MAEHFCSSRMNFTAAPQSRYVPQLAPGDLEGTRSDLGIRASPVEIFLPVLSGFWATTTGPVSHGKTMDWAAFHSRSEV